MTNLSGLTMRLTFEEWIHLTFVFRRLLWKKMFNRGPFSDIFHSGLKLVTIKLFSVVSHNFKRFSAWKKLLLPVEKGGCVFLFSYLDQYSLLQKSPTSSAQHIF
ncbi:hypothetical protein CHARACLAT_014872 [Characodon lateralis]|uniref:Uncharacterized protein n=1 Tax=Characodon lateralis TaxID=208331 RepID=A0ABU7ETT0_9TELE|nr:hypothetical protein [Characodon lateralis]